MTLSICLLGAPGRMGRSILGLMAQDEGLALGGALCRPGHPWEGRDVFEALGLPPQNSPNSVATSSLADAIAGADVLLDLSSPALLEQALPLAAKAGLPVVSGTTGLSAAQHALINDLSAQIPILLAANMSLGVNVLLAMVKQASAALGPAFDGEILEIHHRHKKDSPSGTALALGEALAEPRGQSLGEVEAYRGRGVTGPRKDDELGIAALRGGDVVGEHRVFFFGEGERLELSHLGTDRRIFARGGLRAARWIHGKPPGRYAMSDVLGL